MSYTSLPPYQKQNTLVRQQSYIPERPQSYLKYQRERGIAGSETLGQDVIAVLPSNHNNTNKYINRFEQFKQTTLPNLRVKNVVKVQAMARGWIARNKKFKNKANEHIAAVQVVDTMVDRVIEDSLIPDLLIQILRKNEFFEDVGLYSSEN